MKLPKTRVITLRDTPGRTERITEHLRDMGVEWQPFEGCDAARWGITTTRTYEIDHPGAGHIQPQKHTGLCISHAMLWIVQQELGLSEMCIMEDDCILHPDWEERYTEGRKHLPPDWDVYLLGSAHCNHKPKEHVGGPVWNVRWPLATHCYIVNHKALPILIDSQRNSGAPIDIALCLRAYPLLNVYTQIPRIADQHLTPLEE